MWNGDTYFDLSGQSVIVRFPHTLEELPKYDKKIDFFPN